MAAERGYQSQVGARAQDVAVQVSPDQFGAGIGRAIGEAGQQLHQQDLRAYQIERRARADAEATDFAKRFAEYRLNMDGITRQLRNGAAEGATGHPEAIRETYEKGRDALFSGITEDSVRRQAEQQFNSFGSGLVERESTWADGKRIAKVVNDAQAISDIASNRIRQMADSRAYDQETIAGRAYIEGLNVDADTKKELQRKLVDQPYAIAFLNGLNDKDPVLARSMMDAGTFNDVLSPQQLEQLRSGADVEIRRGQAAAEHEAAMKKAAVREDIATLKEADSQGLEIEPARLISARDSALAMGDKSTALELDGMIANNAYAKIFRGQTPVQREARLTELSRKEKPSEAEQRELKWLRDHAGSLDNEFNSDPVGYAAKYGTGSSVPPPIDAGDPQSFAARLQWRRQYSAATGRPVPVFSDNELVPLRERVSSGPAGRIEVLRALDAIPSIERAQAAAQIVPNDTSFKHEALIEPFARATVFAGREKLQADRGFLNPDRKTPQGTRAQQLLNISGTELDFALRNAGPGDADAVKQIAGQWLAGWLASKGRDINSITPTDIRNAATLALGGKNKAGTYVGGIGHWAGGQPYAVPDDFSHTGFQNFVARQRAADDKKRAGPVDASGEPFDLNRAYPVLIGTDTYRWETPGGSTVMSVKGGPYITRIFRKGAPR